MVRRHVRLAAVLVVVVLALTGFSSSHSGGKGGKGGRGKSSSSSGGGGGGGGGCSSSKKSNGGYRDYDNDDDYSSSGSSSGSDSYTTSPTPTDSATGAATASVVDCVNKGSGKRKADTSATVKVVAGAGAYQKYEIDVVFLDAAGEVVDRGYTKIGLDGGETKTVQVRMQSPKSVGRVKKCEAEALIDD